VGDWMGRCRVSVLVPCRTSGPSQVTCVDFDVLLPVKVQDKLGVPAIDPLLEDKQVRWGDCCLENCRIPSGLPTSW
jgi:hypothetical protein